MKTILLIVAIAILVINIILTILEAIHEYRCIFSCGAHSGRNRGISELICTGPEAGMSGDMKKGRIKINGMHYNVEWLILGEVGVLYNEETGKK